MKHRVNSVKKLLPILALVALHAGSASPGFAADDAARPQRQMLTRDKLPEYQQLLLEPIARWVEEGDFLARIVSSADFVWELSPTWTSATNANADRYQLDDQGGLRPLGDAAAVPTGLPFPGANVAAEQDRRHKAFKILWNANAMQRSAEQVVYDLSISWVGVQAVLRTARGTWYRQSSTDPAQSWSERQVFQLQTPPVVLGFAEIVWRSVTADEDRVWIHSPVIGKSRQIHPANREDRFLDGVLTSEDLFVFSDKAEHVDARVVAERELLVPFPSLSPVPLEENGGPGTGAKLGTQVAASNLASGLPPATQNAPSAEGSRPELLTAANTKELLIARGTFRRNDGGMTAVQWNHETQTFTKFPLWNPTSAVFIPRKVWVIELWPRSPFTKWGRQVVVFDQESYLPAYKIVYDRSGALQRTVIGGWNLARTRENTAAYPFAAFVVAVRPDGEESVTVSVDAVGVLPEVAETARSRFAALLQVEQHENAEKVAKKETPAEGSEPAASSAQDPSAQATSTLPASGAGSENLEVAAETPTTSVSQTPPVAARPGLPPARSAVSTDRPSASPPTSLPSAETTSATSTAAENTLNGNSALPDSADRISPTGQPALPASEGSSSDAAERLRQRLAEEPLD